MFTLHDGITHCMCAKRTHIVTIKLLVSATCGDLGRRCFSLTDWKDPQEETEGREPVGRRGKKKNLSVGFKLLRVPRARPFIQQSHFSTTNWWEEKKNEKKAIYFRSFLGFTQAGFGSSPKWDEEKTARFKGNRSQPLKIFIGLFIDIFSGDVLSRDLFNGNSFKFPPRILQPLIRPQNKMIYEKDTIERNIFLLIIRHLQWCSAKLFIKTLIRHSKSSRLTSSTDQQREKSHFFKTMFCYPCMAFNSNTLKSHSSPWRTSNRRR